MKLGTYSTFDCPCIHGQNQEGEKRQDYEKTQTLIKEAHEWLQKEFDKIGGKVRVYNNDHDFGVYQSFEIDYPKEIENINFYGNEDEMSDDDLELENKKQDWEDNADKIQVEYSNKFNKYL